MDERYEIGRQIGKGGGGLVFRGYDTFLKRDVAIKRILTTDKASADEVRLAGRNLLGEAQTLSTLNHPNIVTIFDVGMDGEGGFVVMELLDGETLFETVRRGVLTQGDFLEMANQTLEALTAAHAVNVMHRDLKPTNVMVIWQPSGRFQTKILDFGLAKLSKKPSVQTLNQDGTVMGSILFMAPEQFERQQLDERTDLYSMGCVYYHSLSGLYPYDGETSADVMKAHLEHRVTPLESLRPDLAPAICQWVMWMINRDMDNRPDSAKEALGLLPRNHELLSKQKLQDVPVEETSKVTLATIVPVAKPVQGANVPKGLRTVKGMNTAPLGSGTTFSRSAGKFGARERIQAQQRKDHGSMVGKVIIAVAVLAAGYLVTMKVLAAQRANHLNQIAAQKVVVADPNMVKLLTGFLFSDKSTLQQKQVAGDALQRMSGKGVDGILLESAKRAPSADARLRLCYIMTNRRQEKAVPDLLEAFQSAENENEKRKILKLARMQVEDAKSRLEGENPKGGRGGNGEDLAVWDIYLEKISSLERAF